MSERTDAEKAYSALLLEPMPRTERDYRRAIVMAVMIGRQLELDLTARIPTDPAWQAGPPATAGTWEVICAETDFQPHLVTVYPFHGELWVDCPDVGRNPVKSYHDGLIETRWRKPAI